MLTRSRIAAPSARRFVSACGNSHGPLALNHRYTTRFSSTSTGENSVRDKAASVAEGIARATSFAFYSAIVLGGVGLAGLTVYYFVSDILLPTSDVQIYKKAFSIIQQDEECKKLIGSSMRAHGETVRNNKWSSTRPIASSRAVDQYGREHIYMQFHVDGELSTAIVKLEMIQSPSSSSTALPNMDFRYLMVDVAGKGHHYLIDNQVKAARGGQSKDPKAGFLGVRWGKS